MCIEEDDEVRAQIERSNRRKTSNARRILEEEEEPLQFIELSDLSVERRRQ